MNIGLTVLSITAPVFLLALVGYLWVRLGYEYRIRFVTQLAMTLSVPCLVFTALQRTEIEPASLSAVSAATVVAYGAVTLVAWIAVRLGRLDRATFLAPLVFGNTGNLGLPIALFAFGEAGLGYAVVIFAIMGVYSFTVGVWLVAGGGSPFRALREPLVPATLLGTLFLWQGWHTPEFLTRSLELIGQMAIPLMLITLGVALGRLSPSQFRLPVLLSAGKFLACLALAWIIGRWFGLDPVAFGVLVVQLTTPVAVTSYLLAEKYGADADTVAGLVVVSTALAVLTLPLTLLLVL